MRLGTDIIEIDRIKEAVHRNEKFVKKILADEELTLYQQYSDHRAYEFLAGRFAAKEAYAKALGTGIGKLKFTDICILSQGQGAPKIIKAPITSGAIVSISHSKSVATATVIIEATEAEIKTALDQQC